MLLERDKLREAVIFLLYKHTFEDIGELNLNNSAYQKAMLVVKELSQIDAIITANLDGYTINRLAKLDLAIIRYAVYELKYDGLAKEIVINEAVNVTKKYSDVNGKQYRFTNSLLDRIANHD